jgi:hypothetical protein
MGDARGAEGRLLNGRERRKYLNNFKTTFKKEQSAPPAESVSRNVRVRD